MTKGIVAPIQVRLRGSVHEIVWRKRFVSESCWDAVTFGEWPR